MLCTFVAMTTTKFLSLILYSLRGLSSLRIFPGRKHRKKAGRYYGIKYQPPHFWYEKATKVHK